MGMDYNIVVIGGAVSSPTSGDARVAFIALKRPRRRVSRRESLMCSSTSRRSRFPARWRPVSNRRNAGSSGQSRRFSASGRGGFFSGTCAKVFERQLPPLRKRPRTLSRCLRQFGRGITRSACPGRLSGDPRRDPSDQRRIAQHWLGASVPPVRSAGSAP